MSLSTLKKDHIKKNLRDTEYDVVIVGGGITGAGIALDASNRDEGSFSRDARLCTRYKFTLN